MTDKERGMSEVKRDQLHAALMEAKATLDAERAELAKVRATCDMLGKERNEADEAKYHAELRLSALQELVRALPVYEADALITVDGDLDAIDRPALRSAVMELLEYRAALTPAGGGRMSEMPQFDNDIEQLKSFYDVTNEQDLIVAMNKHIVKLQNKLGQLSPPEPAVRQVRA